MFNKLINSTVLNTVAIKCLDIRFSWFKSFSVIFILIISLAIFSIELVIKKIMSRIGFTEESYEEPHVTTAS